MTPVTYYQTDDSGIFLHAVAAYPFPMEKRLNVPYQAVQIAPPEIPTGHRARWVSPFGPMDPEYDTAGEWVIEEIPAPAEPAEESTAESPAQA
ncbi:phage tail protein [Herbaspirillum huttiense]